MPTRDSLARVRTSSWPEAARPLLEKWLHSSDPDIAWVMKGNLGKARMSALGTSSLAQLKVSPARSKSKLSHPMRKP